MSKLGHSRWLVWLWGGVVAAMLGGVLVMVGLFVYFGRELPSPDRVVRREGFATKIYDRNGSLLYDVFDRQKRTQVDLDEVPTVLRQSTIAIEDKGFYDHQGFDPLTPLRIVWNVVTRRRVIGGSTLTQQLVKNTLLSPERTITRKLKEFILTVQVERKYSKDQILQMYLNEAPYGGTAYGVEAASQMYFDKPVSKVNLAEAAILAGLPQSPTRYSPLSSKAYIDRARDVLRRMREDRYITFEEEKRANEEVSALQIASQSGVLEAPHFVFYVKQVLAEKYGERVVEQGGLRVTTTLDLDLQRAAQKSVSEEVAKVKHLKITNGAVVVLDPKTGQILVMVGSRDWADPDYDGKYNVTTASRQPGSAIKPVTYLTGLRKGYTAATLLMDTKTVFPGGDKPEYIPENYDGKFRGQVLVREALGNSLNVPAVKMLSLVGVRDMLATAYELGINTLNPTPEFLKRMGLSVTLGGGEVRLLELVSAYSVFANGGWRVDPVAILKVEDGRGNVLEEWKEVLKRRVVSEGEAFIISSILSDPKAREITFGSRSLLNFSDRSVAVKTGTTNDKRDNWTVGWTPNAMVGVWVGNNDNSPMKEVASGVTGASPIWRKILLAALKDKPKEDFVKPEEVVEAEIDTVSGFASHDGFASKKEYFIRGTEPFGDDPVHKQIKVCKGEGKLAGPADIASNNFEVKEAFYFKEEDPFADNWQGQNKWQEGVLNWLNGQADPKYHPPTEYCSNSNPMWITILEPADRTRVDTNEIKVRADVADPNKVTKVEFYVDGVLRGTLEFEPWEMTVTMTDGVHRIEIKAWDEKGFYGSRYVEIGVNQPYVEASPTPTP